MALFLPVVLFVCSLQMASLAVVSQHRRSFVFKVLVKELSIRSIIIRWVYPFPWYDAWESYADASGAVDPGGGGAARELFAEVRGEVVAVLGEEVVRGALEFYGCLVLLALTYVYVVWVYTSCIMASSSSCGLNEKPWSSAVLNVPPGGSSFGLVQYTPVML
jgi:hypothetical protein